MLTRSLWRAPSRFHSQNSFCIYYCGQRRLEEAFQSGSSRWAIAKTKSVFWTDGMGLDGTPVKYFTFPLWRWDPLLTCRYMHVMWPLLGFLSYICICLLICIVFLIFWRAPYFSDFVNCISWSLTDTHVMWLGVTLCHPWSARPPAEQPGLHASPETWIQTHTQKCIFKEAKKCSR